MLCEHKNPFYKLHLPLALKDSSRPSLALILRTNESCRTRFCCKDQASGTPARGCERSHRLQLQYSDHRTFPRLGFERGAVHR